MIVYRTLSCSSDVKAPYECGILFRQSSVDPMVWIERSTPSADSQAWSNLILDPTKPYITQTVWTGLKVASGRLSRDKWEWYWRVLSLQSIKLRSKLLWCSQSPSMAVESGNGLSTAIQPVSRPLIRSRMPFFFYGKYIVCYMNVENYGCIGGQLQLLDHAMSINISFAHASPHYKTCFLFMLFLVCPALNWWSLYEVIYFRPWGLQQDVSYHTTQLHYHSYRSPPPWQYCSGKGLFGTEIQRESTHGQFSLH